MILAVEIHEVAVGATADPRLTPGEVADCGSRASSVAARIAAKIALFRALGLDGHGSEPPWNDAWIVRDEAGKPSFGLAGQVAERVRSRGASRIHVSLTHDDGRAAALVLLEG